MAKILCTKAINYDSLQLLKDAGHTVEILDAAYQELESAEKYATLLKKTKNFDALITMLSDTIDSDFIKRNSHLKIISQYAVGTNNIDLIAAKEHQIVVTNTPDVLTHATAELAFALLLSCSRNLVQARSNASTGAWKGWEPQGFLGPSLKNSKVGIIGAGRIGQAFATMCKGAFNCEIFYSSRSQRKDFDARRLSLPELFQECDVISIHCPLTQDTESMINANVFEHTTEEQILINTARGEIINQEDLIRALDDGKFHAVGLDVTTPEPLPKEHRLFNYERVLITPHIGSATFEARKDMGNLVASNILSVLSDLPAQSRVTY